MAVIKGYYTVTNEPDKAGQTHFNIDAQVRNSADCDFVIAEVKKMREALILAAAFRRPKPAAPTS